MPTMILPDAASARPAKGSGRLAPAAAAAPALSRRRSGNGHVFLPLLLFQSHSGTHCGSFTLRDPGRVSALIRVISASVEREVEDVEILGQPLGPRRLGDGDDVGLLDKPAQRHLRGGAAVRAGDRLDHRIAGDLAERDRAIGDDRHAVPAQRRQHRGLVEIWVVFDLLGGERLPGQAPGLLQQPAGEVRQADVPRTPVALHLVQRTDRCLAAGWPGWASGAAAGRLRHPELAQALVHRALEIAVGDAIGPHLRRDENAGRARTPEAAMPSPTNSSLA